MSTRTGMSLFMIQEQLLTCSLRGLLNPKATTHECEVTGHLARVVLAAGLGVLVHFPRGQIPSTMFAVHSANVAAARVAIKEPLLCRAIIAAVVRLCQPLVPRVLQLTSEVAVAASPRTLAFLYKLLFPLYWADGLHGVNASAVPLLKDTWLGRTYPDMLSVQCYDTEAWQWVRGQFKGIVTTTHSSIETWLQQGGRTTVCVPPVTAGGNGPDAAMVVEMRNDREGTTAMVVMVAHLDVLWTGPRAARQRGAAGYSAGCTSQLWPHTAGDQCNVGDVKWVVSCGALAVSTALAQHAPMVADISVFTAAKRRAAGASGSGLGAATRVLRSNRSTATAVDAGDADADGTDADTGVLTHVLGLRQLRQLARCIGKCHVT